MTETEACVSSCSEVNPQFSSTIKNAPVTGTGADLYIYVVVACDWSTGFQMGKSGVSR